VERSVLGGRRPSRADFPVTGPGTRAHKRRGVRKSKLQSGALPDFNIGAGRCYQAIPQPTSPQLWMPREVYYFDLRIIEGFIGEEWDACLFKPGGRVVAESYASPPTRSLLLVPAGCSHRLTICRSIRSLVRRLHNGRVVKRSVGCRSSDSAKSTA